jgi:hypothetical protein
VLTNPQPFQQHSLGKINNNKIQMNRDEPLPNISVLLHHRSSSSSTAKEMEGIIDRYSSSSSVDERIIEANESTGGGKQKQQQRHHSSFIKPHDIRPYDVLCGRDKAVFNSIGNRRFRVSISVYIPRYEMARNKGQKATVIMFVCNILRNEVGVRFLKKEQPRGGGGGAALKKGSSSESEEEYHYIELDEAEARKKVGHALRDMSVARKQLNEKRKSLMIIHNKKGTPAKQNKRQRDNDDDVKQLRQHVSDDTFDDLDDDDEGLMNCRRPGIAEGSTNFGDSLTALLPYVSQSKTSEEEDTTSLEPLPIHGEKSLAQQHSPQDDDDPRRVSIHEHEHQHHKQELKSQSQQQPQQAMEGALQTQQQQQQQQQQEQQDPHSRFSLSYLQQQQQQPQPQLQLQQLQQQFQLLQNRRRRLLQLQQQQQQQQQIERQRQQQHLPMFGIQQQQRQQDPYQMQQQQRQLQLQHYSYHQQQQQKHQDQDQDHVKYQAPD